MHNSLEADAIVVGAGSAGSYFAWRLSRAGYRVLILEARRLSDLGKHIEIFHMDQVRFDQFEIPHPEPPELIHTEEASRTWSPDLRTSFPVRYPFYVLHMPAFLQRMHGYARQAGVALLESAEVDGLIVESGRLVGVRGTRAGERFEARAKLVVDASGLKAAVRSRLPDAFGVENTPVPAANCLFVCLEFRDKIQAGFPSGSNSYLYHKAFWNRSWGTGAILGIGQPLGFDHAWRQHSEWRQECFGDPGEVLYRRQGVVPFHRPPLSLVGDGLMVIGDAANQNKPFSGEGVTSGFTAARIAAEVAAAALRAEDTGRQRLWAYNVRYFRGQGAKFAAGLAQLPAAAELSRNDVDYLFRRRVLFARRDFEELNLNYEIRMGVGALLRTALLLAWGVITRQFAVSSLQRFLQASASAGRLRSHYLDYPATPEGFDRWAGKAKRLWGEAA